MLLHHRPRYTPRALMGGGGVLLVALVLLVSLTTREGEATEDEPTRPPNVAAIIARTPEAMVEARKTLLSAPESEPAAVESAAPATEAPPEFAEHAGRFGRKQTLSGLFAEHGLGTHQVNSVVRALEPHFNFRRARARSKYRLKIRNADKRVESFVFEHSALEIFEAVREGDELVGRKAKVNVRTDVAALGAEIQSSLYKAIQRVGESPGIASSVVEVFAWDIDFFKDTRPGDNFRVLIEKIYKDDTFIHYGRILAAEYVSKTKGTFRTYWFEPQGSEHAGYYLADGQNARKTFLATPLKFVRVSSGFGTRRHPVLGYTKKHLGVDFAAPTGTPVWAMADGVVRYAGYKGANGNLVVIKHGGGLVSLYAHLHKIKVKRGQKVRQKQVVGTVGTTGRSTGPHLHFGVKKNGKHVNPRRMKMSRGDPVPKHLRGAFAQTVERLQSQLDAIRIGGPATVTIAPTTVVVEMPPSDDVGPPAPEPDAPASAP